MTLIKNISGFRGTIGGNNLENLTPTDIVTSISAFSRLIKEKNPNSSSLTVITGRDGRKSGRMIHSIVNSTFNSMGINVIDAGLSTTPTICWGVLNNDSVGGLMITASHNPEEYNGLKFFNSDGEFLSKEDVSKLIEYSESKNHTFSSNNSLGNIAEYDRLIDDHVDAILNLDILPLEEIKELKLTVSADAINSGGSLAIPKLLDRLNIKYNIINSEIEGIFNHTPEPLAENLTDLSKSIQVNKSDFGIAVDPDVDRLAFVDEKGIPFGEEYTLVACAYHLLSIKVGNSVSNLSSTHALKDVTENFGGNYYSSPVGEANVVKLMKEKNAIIGGEGNGGIILPEIHYGRDALVGTALFLSLLSSINKSTSQLKNEVLPKYHICKGKISLNNTKSIKIIFDKIKSQYIKSNLNLDDGVKIIFNDSWVHIRSSNTEPIIRIYSEAKTKDEAEKLNKKFKEKISELV